MNYGSAVLFLVTSVLLCFFFTAVVVILYSSGKRAVLIEQYGRMSLPIMIVHLKCLKILTIAATHFHMELRWSTMFVIVSVLSYWIAVGIVKYFPYLLRMERAKT